MFFSIISIISIFNIAVKGEIVKGSFWQPSGGNSCGFTDQSIWGGDVVALSPLSKYYGRDTVSAGPDQNNFFQYPGCGIRCTLRCVEALFEFPKDPCFDTSQTIEVVAVDTCPECVDQVDISQQTFVQLAKQEAGLAIFELLCGEDIGNGGTIVEQPVDQGDQGDQREQPVDQGDQEDQREQPVDQGEQGKQPVDQGDQGKQPVDQGEQGKDCYDYECENQPVQQEDQSLNEQVQDIQQQNEEFITKEYAIKLLIYIVEYYNTRGITWQEHDSIKFWTLTREI